MITRYVPGEDQEQHACGLSSPAVRDRPSAVFAVSAACYLCSLWTVLTVDTRPRSDVGACARLRKFRLAIYMARGKVAYKRTFCNLFHNYTIRYIYPRTRTPAPLSALASDVSRLSALCLCVQYCDCSTTQIHQGLQTPLTARLLPASCMLWEPRTARTAVRTLCH